VLLVDKIFVVAVSCTVIVVLQSEMGNPVTVNIGLHLGNKGMLLINVKVMVFCAHGELEDCPMPADMLPCTTNKGDINPVPCCIFDAGIGTPNAWMLTVFTGDCGTLGL